SNAPMPSQPTNPAAGLVAEALALYESNLIGYATSILGGVEERRRDVVQDTLLKLYLAAPERVRENLKAWLYAVCRNRAFDVLRKENRLVLSDDGEPMEWLDEWQPDPSDEAGRDELLGHIWT